MAPWQCAHEFKNTHRLTDAWQNTTGKNNATKYLVADSSETEESKSQSQLHDKYRANGIQWIMYASGEQYPRWKQDTV